jgi:pSer/pThr/pTyr-binding forkhead associated (FHA) protein
MQLRYEDGAGQTIITEFGTAKAITLGRDRSCDILIHDEQASRIHCEIRLWQDDYVLKDLKSQNGTCVNDSPITVVDLKAGDVIKIGDASLFCEIKELHGNTTAFLAIEEDMDAGKGYGTILRKILTDIDKGDSSES